ncbi:MAG: Hpt domain-containing protein [Rhodospirillales bacterium]|nr:Hpt domain-containing protein [Rhodospirillales bacterium]
MSGTSSKIDEFVEQVRREFIESTSERLNSVDDLITAMMDSQQFDESLVEFLRQIHSIKGLGGTFDFPTVSTIAHRLEDYIETAPEFAARQFKDIQYFVDVIRRIIESGIEPDASELSTLLKSLPVTAKDFADIEAFDDNKPIQDVRLLLVMPKGTQRKIIGKELAACGFQIANSDTPVEAVKYAIDHKPDIVIVSRVMEQMGGREMARVLATIDATKDCRIIIAATTGKGDTAFADLPESTRVIQKGPGFIDDLTDCLSGWGFFG